VSGTLGLVWHDRYVGRGFVPRRASWSRYALAARQFADAGLFRSGLRVVAAPAATDAELLSVHDGRYLGRLRELDALGSGMVDGRQTPAYRGMFHRAAVAVGGTVLATRVAAEGRIDHVFNPAGGLHHAHADRASGFCLLNDIAVAVRDLRSRGLRRLAVLDLDAHHGDGTQAIFWREDVLTLSIHEHGRGFFPGSGSADEVGAGEGAGYDCNLPLPRDADDSAFTTALDRAILRIRQFRPQVLIVQFGTDGHRDDPFSHLALSDDAYLVAARRLHDLAHQICGGALVLLGGGGYVPETVARIWTAMLRELSGPTA
jgi:acetoin utilization protein AcuC